MAAKAEGGERVFSGTVEINAIQLGFMISGRAGSSVLDYEGQEYYFG